MTRFLHAITLILGSLSLPALGGPIFYYNVDQETGGPVEFTANSADVMDPGDGTRVLSYHFTATNTGPELLTDVAFVLQFNWYEDDAFTYDNASHQWNYADKWLKAQGVMGQDQLLPMGRSSTDTPLTWAGASVLESDEVTMVPIGDLWPGHSLVFDLNVQVSEPFDFTSTGFLVSTVPEPATFGLLALGGAVALIRRRRS